MGVKTQKCRMCKKSQKIIFYNIHYIFTDTNIEACEKCALREVYGSRWKSNRRYLRDKKEGKL